MALDEYIFGKAARFLKKSKTDYGLLTRRVLLNEAQQRLTVMARALTGEAIDIVPALEEGGFKGLHFFLPTEYSLMADKETNLQFFIFRVLYLSAQRKLKLNWLDNEDHPTHISRKKALETAPIVLNILQQDYPLSMEIHDKLKKELDLCSENRKEMLLHWLYGKWMTEEKSSSQEKLLNEPNEMKAWNAKNKAASTLKAKAVEQVSLLKVDKKSQEDYVMTHNFEKVETAEEYDGVWRDFDGSDQLEEHADALDELQMKFVVRTDEPTHSVYHSEFTEQTTISESADIQSVSECILYDEWDYKKSAYRKDFCKVYPEFPVQNDSSYYQKVISENGKMLAALRKMLAHVNNKRMQIRYQTQGEEFDNDQVTDMFVDLINRRTPNEKIYFSTKKAEKDISILLLLDSSMSTDSYAAGNRVIDVEKQVSILFGEILFEYGIDFSIASFSSHTRNHSRFVTIKHFDGSWNQARNKIGSIEPQGYTRIGASIRHAGSLLKQRPTRNKWIIFVSDGKPNDFDKYEGQYGIQDVKQSLRELSAVNVHTFALAIEARARYYLPQMFGQNHYQILTRPDELLHALVKLYTKIKSL